MYKRILLTMVIFLCTLGFAAGPAEGRSVTVIVEGKGAVSEDTPAYIKQERTMVPLRAISEAFGFKVLYTSLDAAHPIQIYPYIPGVNDHLKGIADDLGYFSLRTGEKTIFFRARQLKYPGSRVTTDSLYDSFPIWSDVAPETTNGRTFVPLRVLSEAFGCKVDWNPDTYTATIGSYDPDVLLRFHPGIYMYRNQDLFPYQSVWTSYDQTTGVAVIHASANVSGTLPAGAYAPCEQVPVQIWVDGKLAGTAPLEYAYPSVTGDPVLKSTSVVASALLSKGQHSVKVVVDPDADFFDTNLSNNTLTTTINI